MAFIPARDTYYRIYFKHSGKCASVRDNSRHRGAQIVQNATEEGADQQLFQIRHIAEDHFAISPKSTGHNFDVPGATHDDGARLIQWERGEHQWHQRFRFVRVGDGYYTMQAVHSNKYIVVNNHSHDDNADLIQWGSSDFDAARVKFVRDGAAYDSITGRDFVSDSNELLRTAVIGIAGLVPEVGGGIKFILGFLWPAEDKPMMVWDQMKRFVTDLVREMINQARLEDLRNKLEGLRNVLRSYESQSFGTAQKGQFFTSLLADFDKALPYFFNASSPETQLPYFVALGTLYIATLREQYLSYDKIYGQADPDRDKHLKKLQDTIRDFTAAALKIRERALAWRLAKIRVEHHTERSGISKNYYWTAIDEYDGWRHQLGYNDTTGGTYNAEALVRGAEGNRIAQAKGAWGGDLDRFLGAAYLWKYLDPTKSDKPKRTAVDMVTGPWGGGREQEFRDDPKGQPITSVVIHAGTKVDGVEMFYGGVSGGLHGKRGGSTHRIDLNPGERIIGIRVRAGEALDGLWFETTEGRMVGAGGRGGNYIIGDPPDDANATLYGIFGRQGTGHVASIGCTWRYYRDE